MYKICIVLYKYNCTYSLKIIHIDIGVIYTDIDMPIYFLIIKIILLIHILHYSIYGVYRNKNRHTLK